MSKSPGFGPFRLRLPIAPNDRRDIKDAAIADGSALAGWPADTLVLKGTWQAGGRPLMLRPIFPGAIRFLADDPKAIPVLEAIDVDAHGRVTADGFKTCALIGKLAIKLQAPGHIGAMRDCGTLPALGVAPRWAIYGPVRLGVDFLENTLLGRKKNGLFGRPVKAIADGKQVEPSDPRWEALALQSFVAGGLDPNLLCGASLDDDDAAKMAMPELIVDAGTKNFALGILLGWLHDPAKALSWPLAADAETIPSGAFLRHVGEQLREAVLGQPKGSLADLLFEGEDSSAGWHDRLREALMGQGFGDIAGVMPLEGLIREFQIAASAAVVATAKNKQIDAAQLGRRDFRDLIAVANGARYSGPISGRANAATRRRLGDWSALGQRSPLLIPAFSWPKGKTRLAADDVPVLPDLWARKETNDTSLRMFCADFTRAKPGAALSVDELQLVGDHHLTKRFDGPRSILPSQQAPVASAEVRPERFGLKEAKLIAAVEKSKADYALASSFRVIRSASEIECYAYLDQINAYDDAGLSYGPCHWSLAGAVDDRRDAPKLAANLKKETELGGFAAFLRYLEINGPMRDVDVFPAQGLMPADRVPLKSKERFSPEAAARNLVNGAPKWPLNFVDDLGLPRDMTEAGVLELIPTWRNLYRWVMIGREHPVIGSATWAMSLRRLRRILELPFPRDKLAPEHVKVMASPTLADIFTSEMTVALLLRWHIFRPSDICYTDSKGVDRPTADYVVKLYSRARDTKSGDGKPKDAAAWQLALRKALIEIAVKRDGGLEGDFRRMLYPAWLAPDPDEGGDLAPAPDRPKKPINEFGYRLDPSLGRPSRKPDSFVLARVADDPI